MVIELPTKPLNDFLLKFSAGIQYAVGGDFGFPGALCNVLGLNTLYQFQINVYESPLSSFS